MVVRPVRAEIEAENDEKHTKFTLITLLTCASLFDKNTLLEIKSMKSRHQVVVIDVMACPESEFRVLKIFGVLDF